MNTVTRLEAESLLREAQEGDSAALGRLLERYAPYLALLARVQIGRRLQSKADPADLVQETFLAAHFSFPRFRGTTEDEFAAWLRRILAARLANFLRNYLGTKGRDVRLERELATELDQSSQALDRGFIALQSSPSHRAVRREQGLLLAAALARLPEDYREIIVLRDLQQLSFVEAARHMGRTVDAVEKLWLRALARLRRAMGGGK